MKFDYSYKRKVIGPWWCNVTAWRNRDYPPKRSSRKSFFAPGDPRFIVLPLTHDQRYILYAMVRPWYEFAERLKLRWSVK